MQDESVDAPSLELTAQPAAGEDALQLGPSDSPEAAANLGDAFSIKNKRPKPEASPPMKVAKAVTAQANDSVVAALMGLKLPSVKAQPAARADAVRPEPSGTNATRAELREETFVPPEIVTTADAIPDQTLAQPVVAIDDSEVSDSSDRYAAAQAADPIDEQVDEPQTSEPNEASIETAPPVLRLVYPPLEDEGVGEQEETPAVELAVVEEPEVAAEVAVQEDPLPNPLPEFRERGPEDMPPANPKPKRAIPVAPQWPSEPPQARPKRHAARPPAPVEMPTPPQHLVPPARQRVTDERTALPALSSEPTGPTGAWWTIPLTFVGIAIVACSILIPASDENRRANYELAKIEQDVNYFERQSAVNKDFIERVNTDATLAERLALRQLHQTRQGVKIAPMSGKPETFRASPFAMTRLDPPQPLPAYQPVDDVLSDWFMGEERSQQMAAIGLVVAGAGVMLGGRRSNVA